VLLSFQGQYTRFMIPEDACWPRCPATWVAAEIISSRLNGGDDNDPFGLPPMGAAF
jgi:hypothetical protein